MIIKLIRRNFTLLAILLFAILSIQSDCEAPKKDERIKLPITVLWSVEDSRRTKVHLTLMNRSEKECFEDITVAITGTEGKDGNRFYKTKRLRQALKLGETIDHSVRLTGRISNVRAEVIRTGVYECDYEL